jgi:hypothetical protein
VKESNVIALANKGGRDRWKIENQGFRAQKRGGYELEHAYTSDPKGAKIYYFCLQLAHMIDQLMYRGSLLGSVGRKALGAVTLQRELSIFRLTFSDSCHTTKHSLKEGGRTCYRAHDGMTTFTQSLNLI